MGQKRVNRVSLHYAFVFTLGICLCTFVRVLLMSWMFTLPYHLPMYFYNLQEAPLCNFMALHCFLNFRGALFSYPQQFQLSSMPVVVSMQKGVMTEFCPFCRRSSTNSSVSVELMSFRSVSNKSIFAFMRNNLALHDWWTQFYKGVYQNSWLACHTTMNLSFQLLKNIRRGLWKYSKNDQLQGPEYEWDDKKQIFCFVSQVRKLTLG